ncbi:MAG TPA: hypothetical protein VM187_10820 [Niastella sp.]|nr:hypothetical protein [Niastella sp.]
MSKKNIPTDLPANANASSTVSESFAPAAQPLLPPSLMDNSVSGASGSSFATPLDSIKEVEIEQAEEGVGAGIWHQNKKVVGLWTIAQTRNAWANISELGWKKFYNGSDSSIVAFNIIAGSALEKQTPVNVLIENNQIIEIYAW